MLDLLFGAAPESPTSATSAKPWTDPLMRQTAAALLSVYLNLFDGYGCKAVPLLSFAESAQPYRQLLRPFLSVQDGGY